MHQAIKYNTADLQTDNIGRCIEWHSLGGTTTFESSYSAVAEFSSESSDRQNIDWVHCTLAVNVNNVTNSGQMDT